MNTIQIPHIIASVIFAEIHRRRTRAPGRMAPTTVRVGNTSYSVGETTDRSAAVILVTPNRSGIQEKSNAIRFHQEEVEKLRPISTQRLPDTKHPDYASKKREKDAAKKQVGLIEVQIKQLSDEVDGAEQPRRIELRFDDLATSGMVTIPLGSEEPMDESEIVSDLRDQVAELEDEVKSLNDRIKLLGGDSVSPNGAGDQNP